MKKEVPLNGSSLEFTWTDLDKGKESALKNRWLPAKVPGNTHLDMWAAGKIGDPFFGTNAKNLFYFIINYLFAYSFIFYISTNAN